MFSEELLKEVERKITGVDDGTHAKGHPRLSRYSQEKLGITCDHLLLDFSLKDCNNTTSVFVKRLCKTLPSNRLQQFRGVFQQEKLFYEQILPLMTQSSSEIPRWHAKCYAVEEDALLLEDMKPAGFTIRADITDNIVCLKAALQSLGHLHGASITAEKKLQGGQKWAAFLHEVGVTERLFTFAKDAGQVVNVGVNLIVELLQERSQAYAGQHDVSESTLRQRVEDVFESAFKTLDDSTMVRAVIHGNLHNRNLLFHDHNKTCILIDFKTFRYAPIALDVAQLLFLHTFKDFRDKHCKNLLSTYHAALIGGMGFDDNQSGLKPELETIIHEYEKAKIFGVICAVVFKPIEAMYLSGGRIFKDDTLWESFLFEDRIQSVKDEMSRNEDFKKSVETAVDQFHKFLL